MSGKMYIPNIHKLVCAFLDVSDAENRMTAIPSFTTGDVSIFRQALSKDGAAKITKDLHRHGLLPELVEFLSPGQAGYENEIGMMPAEERMAASEKGYENGIGMMPAEERMAASEKGYENGLGAMSAEERMAAAGIVWEKKLVEFKSYDGMPEKGTPLHTWQKNQLGNSHASCLNAKIQKELAENEGSTVWIERRVKLALCGTKEA